MKKFHIILIVTIGFLLMPTVTFACGKHSCKKEISKSIKDDCCSKDNKSGKSHDGCGGKCGHKQCGCTSVCPAGFSSVIPSDYRFQASSIIEAKQNFFHYKSAISSGYFSLWLIPKIS